MPSGELSNGQRTNLNTWVAGQHINVQSRPDVRQQGKAGTVTDYMPQLKAFKLYFKTVLCGKEHSMPKDLIHLVGFPLANPGQEKEGLLIGSGKANGFPILCQLLVTGSDCLKLWESWAPLRLTRECNDWLMMSALGTGGAHSCHGYATPGVEKALLIPLRTTFKMWLFLLRAEKSF